MATTKQDIREWFERAKTDPDVTHMLVVCDMFDYEDYPVSVYSFENVLDRIKEYSKNMQKVMEVYSMKLPMESQLNEHRSWNTE